MNPWVMSSPFARMSGEGQNISVSVGNGGKLTIVIVSNDKDKYNVSTKFMD